MGVVYLAEHVHLQRKVALKLLAPEVSEQSGFRERFIRESRLAARLHHPHVVTVYDAGDADGLLYISMHYVEGTDLADVLRRDGAMEPDRALALVEQVASALDAAHEIGLVHRDVKPANVLIDGQRAYLTDFGLTKYAAAASGLTSANGFLGTPHYAAPEQIRGETVDRRADVYSLACMLWECLAGRPP